MISFILVSAKYTVTCQSIYLYYIHEGIYKSFPKSLVDDRMKAESALEKIKILNGDVNRKILELLLQGPKDFNSLRRESRMSRSTVFDSLRILMDADIVERKKLPDRSRGRPAYEYSIKEFFLPELNKNNLLDFLKGMNLDAKSIRLTDMSILDNLIDALPISIEFILYMMISSGFKFVHAFQILVDLESDLKSEVEYGELIDKIIKIAEDRYPIDEIALKIFKDRSTEKICIKSEKDEDFLTLEHLKNITYSELHVEEYEAEYIAQKIWTTLTIMGIYEIEYPSLVNLMYILAKNTKIICKTSPYFYRIINLPNFDDLNRINLIETDKVTKKSKGISWSSKEIAHYLERKMNFDKSKCNLIANTTIEKLSSLGLEKYDFNFLDSLIKELIRELKF